jgi:hypothetical protein
MTVTFDLARFKTEFQQLTNDWTWEIQGFIDQANNVYPIDSDTKVLSTVFERLASPVIRSLGESQGYRIEVANQTTYPDFTLSMYDSDNRVIHRIALDIKTTYCELKKNSDSHKGMLFTLGSYKSFIRNNTKNILHPYDTYNEHWILGFIYKRNAPFQEYNLETMPQRNVIQCPYTIESTFITEKVKITGLRAGSGNTANIGSIKLFSPSEFENHSGPFWSFRNSKSACDHYWCNYDVYKTSISNAEELLSHPDFQQFK